MSDRPIRVAIWGMGPIGSLALNAIRKRPSLNLVRAAVHSTGKVGRDAGELAGGAPVSVTAVADIKGLLATKPDCVIYSKSSPEREHGAGPMLATAMQVVNAIPYVVAAEPGLHSCLTLPLTAPLEAFD